MHNEYYSNQNQVVVTALVKEGMSKESAVELWMRSETRKKIQDELKLEFVSGARCYDELQKEIAKDPYWLQGSFI